MDPPPPPPDSHHVAAGVGLGQAEGGDLLPPGLGLQPALLLGLAAPAQQGQAVQRQVHREDDPQRGVPVFQLLAGQPQADVVEIENRRGGRGCRAPAGPAWPFGAAGSGRSGLRSRCGRYREAPPATRTAAPAPARSDGPRRDRSRSCHSPKPSPPPQAARPRPRGDHAGRTDQECSDRR